MPKWTHDNPRVERLIVELDLAAWESRRERERRARDTARREREAEALRAVPWEDLSPAELAFRWVLEHDRERYAQWCAEARAAFAARTAGGHERL